MRQLIIAFGLTCGIAAAQDAGPAAAGVPTRLPPESVQIWATGSGDVDADGDVDLLVLNEELKGQLLVSSLGVLRSDGNGGYAEFEELGVVPQDERVWGLGPPIRIEDLTSDGIADLLAPNVGVFPGLGGGEFGPLIPLGAEDQFLTVINILVGHIDGDEQLDMLLEGVSPFGLAEQIIFLGQADGSFAAQPLGSFGIASPPVGAAVALSDLDADGDLDFVMTTCVSDQGVAQEQLLQSQLNDGTGHFGAPIIGVVFPNCASLEASFLIELLRDLDADGFPDLLVRSSNFSVWPVVTQGQVYRGDGVGGFAFAGTLDSVAELESSGTWLTGDFNGDRVVDLAVTVKPFHYQMLRGIGDLTFEPATSMSLQSFVVNTPPHVARLNDDEIDDVIAATAVFGGGASFAVVPAFGSSTPFVDLGFGSGDAQLVVTGSTIPNAAVELQLLGVPSGTPALLALSLEVQPTSFPIGTLIPDAMPQFFISAGTTLRTRWPENLPGSTSSFVSTVHVQALTLSTDGLQLSNVIAAVAQ